MKTLINEFIIILYMPSSVTIPDELRRKIKQLAAFFDTSQADIIERAITEYEQLHVPKEDITNPEIIVHLTKVSNEVHRNDPDRRTRFEKLNAPGIAIEAIAPAIWGRSVDE
jgi:hypothetical protein